MYDDHGNRIEEAAFDVAGNKKWAGKYDEHGKLIEEAFFDVTGNLTKTQKYNNEGKLIGGEEFTVADNVNPPQTDYKFTQKHDERGNLVYKAYFDEMGNPTTFQPYSFHSFTQKYDEQDNFLAFATFDVAGNPTLYKDGYHILAKNYEDGGKQIEWAYFGVTGQPIQPKHVSYHKLVGKFDEQGLELEIETAYFDVAGNLIKKFQRGNLVYQAYFDEAGNPILSKDGYHKFTAKFDENDNPIEAAYFDVNGQPLKTEIVVVRVRAESQGEKLGLQVGDVFTHYDGEPVSEVSRFTVRRNAELPDSPAKELQVLRDGKVLTFAISSGELGVELENRVLASTARSAE